MVPGALNQVSAVFVGIASEMGKPFVSRFLPEEIDRLLRQHGFGATVDFGPQEALAEYFQGRTDVGIGGAEAAAWGAVRDQGHY